MKKLFIIPIMALAMATQAQQYSIDWQTIDGGGGTSMGLTYSVSGTIGQPDAGPAMNGTQYSVVGGFWSLFAPGVASVEAGMATNAATNSVTISATVNPDGLTSRIYVQWGTTTNYGSFSLTNTLVAGTTNMSINIALSGLAPLTVYHCRVVAENGAGVSYGSDLTFETLSP